MISDEGRFKKSNLNEFLSNISENISRFETDATFDYSQSLLSNAEAIEKSGWLLKKSNSIFRGYQRRFFLLKDRRLSYYRKESDSQPAGTINFDLLTVDVQISSPHNPNKIFIKALGSKRVFVLKSVNPKEIIDWAITLHRHIHCSEGKKLDLTTTSQQKEFWRFDRVSEEQFRFQASTGDLILFKGKSVAAKLQRGVTNSRYDHVAIILCYSTGDIAILEATGTEGVAIVQWDDFMRYGWHLLYNRIAFRKLLMDRSTETLTKLEAFIDSTRGKKYKISPKKLLKKTEDREPGHEDHFFCSELIASAYKALGVLSPEIPSSKYWPGDFEGTHDLGLIQAELSEEIMIDFEL